MKTVPPVFGVKVLAFTHKEKLFYVEELRNFVKKSCRFNQSKVRSLKHAKLPFFIGRPLPLSQMQNIIKYNYFVKPSLKGKTVLLHQSFIGYPITQSPPPHNLF